MVEHQHIAIGLLAILCVLLGSDARCSCRNAKLILGLVARALWLGQANGRLVAIHCDWLAVSQLPQILHQMHRAYIADLR